MSTRIAFATSAHGIPGRNVYVDGKGFGTITAKPVDFNALFPAKGLSAADLRAIADEMERLAKEADRG